MRLLVELLSLHPDIFGVARSNDGALTWLNNNPPFPAEKNGGFYCPWLAAADPTNHLVVAMEPINSNCGQDGLWQLAIYRVDKSGNPATNSTYSSMPSALVGAVNNYWMSPDGKYLAVSGTSGLQIFRFNSANYEADRTDCQQPGTAGLLGQP